MDIVLDTNNIDDYRKFIIAKSLPRFRCVGSRVEFPDEYAGLMGVEPEKKKQFTDPSLVKGLFDYQRDIIKFAAKKRKFAIFADCGLGKTIMLLELAKYARQQLPSGKRVLILSPLMVVSQTIKECQDWYGGSLGVERVVAMDLAKWVHGTGGIGITNYDALTDDISQGNIGAVLLDESSMLKSHYGKWGSTCVRIGDGVEFKWCFTGTPAPNDRIEYANHAVFLDAFPTVNSFLARYFVNKGQTQERWILKPHALESFYRDISDWCVFLTNPATYGWKDNCGTIPPINVHVHDIAMTDDQSKAVYDLTGELFMGSAGGITKRAKLARIGKGDLDGVKIASLKPAFIQGLVSEWGSKESTIIWCHFNREQEQMELLFPDAVSIKGETDFDDRESFVEEFKSGQRKIMISKPKCLGFGLNLQVATRQVFSGLQDSYESYYQAVKRSNRYGSTQPLNVHIPVTEIERPMIESVLVKAGRVQRDTEEQERIFKQSGRLKWVF